MKYIRESLDVARHRFEDQITRPDLVAHMACDGFEYQHLVADEFEAEAQVLLARQAWLMERLLKRIIGPRCKMTDKEDFPEVDNSDPKNKRCPNCEAWERFDKMVSDLEVVNDRRQ